MPDPDRWEGPSQAEAARRRAEFQQRKREGLGLKWKIRLIAVGVVVLLFLIGWATQSMVMGMATGLAGIVAWFVWQRTRGM